MADASLIEISVQELQGLLPVSPPVEHTQAQVRGPCLPVASRLFVCLFTLKWRNISPAKDILTIGEGWKSPRIHLV